jgi:hypothetical protein
MIFQIGETNGGFGSKQRLNYEKIDHNIGF